KGLTRITSPRNKADYRRVPRLCVLCKGGWRCCRRIHFELTRREDTSPMVRPDCCLPFAKNMRRMGHPRTLRLRSGQAVCNPTQPSDSVIEWCSFVFIGWRSANPKHQTGDVEITDWISQVKVFGDAGGEFEYSGPGHEIPR